MFSKIGALFFLGSIVFFVLFVYSAVKDKGSVTRNGMIAGCLLVISIVLVIAGSRLDLSALDTLIYRVNGKALNYEETAAQKKQVNETFGAFLNRTQADMDRYWKLYLDEPMQRLAKDGNVDTFKADAERILDKFAALMSEIDHFPMPTFVSDMQAKNAAELKTDVFNAVYTRRSIARTLVDLKDAKHIIETDISIAVEQSNQYMQAASEAFARMKNE